jgi:hypothetical protein
MATFEAAVTRTSLGLPALDINDNSNYIVSAEIMGGTVTRERKSVSSPYVHGDIPVHSRKTSVTEPFAVYVMGESQSELQQNLVVLIDAFSQFQYNILLSVDGTEYLYLCEAAEYQIEWEHAHWHAQKVVVRFNVPRNPIAVTGV